MTREELVSMRAYKIAQASTEYWNKNMNNDEVSIMTAFEDGAEWADEHSSIFNQCINEQSPDYLAGYDQGRKDANPEIAYLEHEIERLKSKLQAADDLNTLLTMELEKAGSSSK